MLYPSIPPLPVDVLAQSLPQFISWAEETSGMFQKFRKCCILISEKDTVNRYRFSCIRFEFMFVSWYLRLSCIVLGRHFSGCLISGYGYNLCHYLGIHFWLYPWIAQKCWEILTALSPNVGENKVVIWYPDAEGDTSISCKDFCVISCGYNMRR